MLAQSKAKADELKNLKSQTAGLMNKLKSTTEELARDEEGIKLLQKMVDDRKNDVSKLASQVQQEKADEKVLQASLKAATDQKVAMQNQEKEVATQKEQLTQKVAKLETELNA